MGTRSFCVSFSLVEKLPDKSELTVFKRTMYPEATSTDIVRDTQVFRGEGLNPA